MGKNPAKHPLYLLKKTQRHSSAERARFHFTAPAEHFYDLLFQDLLKIFLGDIPVFIEGQIRHNGIYQPLNPAIGFPHISV
jgi:hypothetical protein